MQVKTYWWGIQISSENAKEEEVLRSLRACLPDKAQSAYEHGDIESDGHLEGVDIGSDGYSVVFHR